MSNRFMRSVFAMLGLAGGVCSICVSAPIITPAATIVADARPGDVPRGTADRDINAMAQSFVDRGKKAFLDRDYETSTTNYSEALILKPGDARLYYNRGLAYYKVRRS